jgi:hypothetical protein
VPRKDLHLPHLRIGDAALVSAREHAQPRGRAGEEERGGEAGDAEHDGLEARLRGEGRIDGRGDAARVTNGEEKQDDGKGQPLALELQPAATEVFGAAVIGDRQPRRDPEGRAEREAGEARRRQRRGVPVWRLALLPRMAYWFATAVLTFSAGYCTVVFLVNLAFPDQRRHPLQIGLVDLAAGIPIAAITVLVNEQVFGALPRTTSEIAGTLINSVVIAGAVSFLYALLDPGERNVPVETRAAVANDTSPSQSVPSPTQVPAANPPRPAILDRLKPELRGALSHLSMQDHYVDVHTDRGHALVLMRLPAAVRETAPVWKGYSSTVRTGWRDPRSSGSSRRTTACRWRWKAARSCPSAGRRGRA